MDREELLKEKDNTIPKERKYLLILLLNITGYYYILARLSGNFETFYLLKNHYELFKMNQ